MKLLVDECCDSLIVNTLRNEGYDILYVMETHRGTDDATIIKLASSEKRIIITEDKNIGKISLHDIVDQITSIT